MGLGRAPNAVLSERASASLTFARIISNADLESTTDFDVDCAQTPSGNKITIIVSNTFRMGILLGQLSKWLPVEKDGIDGHNILFIEE
jgi:hypothetical protein